MSTIFSVPQLILSDLTITVDEYPKLAFEETLDMFNSEEEIIDKVTVAVEKSEGTFMVYQYSQNDNNLLRIQSRVLRSLDTHTEIRRIVRASSESTKMMMITGRETSYNVFTTVQESTDSWRQKMEIDRSPTESVVMEGANILLLRKIAISRLFGRFETRIINHDMELCDCTYDIDQSTDCGEVTVRRTLKGLTSIETMTTVLSPEGRIISHRWSNSSCWLVGHPELRKTEEGTIEEEQEPEEETVEPLKADQDAYFQRKEEVLQKLKQYLLDHSDIQDLIADFIKNVMFEEPEDVLEFADNFFSEFLGIERSPETDDEQKSEYSDFSQYGI